MSIMEDPCALWRHRWRGIGLAVDRLLPVCFSIPSPSLDSLRLRVVEAVNVPESGRCALPAEDKRIVSDAVEFVAAVVASELPVHVVASDMRPLFSALPTGLAIRGSGVNAGFVGSFDLLARVHASKGPWRFYNQKEVVVDVKVTGCARPLGVNSQTILEILRHGQLVLKAWGGHRSNDLLCMKTLTDLWLRSWAV